MAREAAGFLTIEEYVRWRQNTVARYIAVRSLLDLCEGSERDPGARVSIRWWEQEGIDISGAREASAAVVVAEEDVGEDLRGGEIERILDWYNGR